MWDFRRFCSRWFRKSKNALIPYLKRVLKKLESNFGMLEYSKKGLQNSGDCDWEAWKLFKIFYSNFTNLNLKFLIKFLYINGFKVCLIFIEIKIFLFLEFKFLIFKT